MMILALIIPWLCLANPEGLFFSISGESIEFIHLDELVVSKNCQNSCVVRTKVLNLLKKKTKLPDPTSNSDISIASRVCKFLGGKSLLGHDNLKNGKAFCFFSEDQSLIDYSSLEFKFKTY
jgi:hypothetical protein